MFLLLAALLFVAWIGGFTMMHVSSVAIHILIILAIVSVIMHVMRGRRTTLT